MVPTVQIAILDDHALLVDGLAAALNAIEGFDVVLTETSLERFMQTAPGIEFDLLLVDMVLKDGSGQEAVRFARHHCDPAALLMTAAGDAHGVQAAIECGCVGFVSKADPVETLVSAIRTAAAGGTVFPAHLFQDVIAPSGQPSAQLTSREQDVLDHLAQGHSALVIAASLDVSVHTVRNHISSLLSKLHANSQLEAVVIAVRTGMVAIS